jgi:DNA-binding NtrC family response regulator
MADVQHLFSEKTVTISKTTILLIDDDQLVLRSLEKALKMNGYNVLAVDGDEAAMSAIRNNNFDLVLSDIRMPGKNGVDIAKEIQSCLIANGKKDLPVIFITGFSGDEMKLQAPLVGETLYKPVDIDRLLTTIRDYL